VQHDSQPERPIDVYKAIVDELATSTSRSVSERLILEHGIWTKAPDEEAANAFVRSLTDEQRHLLVRMLQERTGAIHDVLAELTWWISTREVGLTFRGDAMPIELSGHGIHGDYIGRLNDWPWPDDDSMRTH
jgi:Family of unknown function (DUF6547)